MHHVKDTYCVTLECLDRLVSVQLTDMDALVGRAGSKGCIALPVNIQRWRYNGIQSFIITQFSMSNLGTKMDNTMFEHI